MLVEPTGLVVLGVNGKGANSGDFRSLNGAQHCVFQESGPKPPALERDRNCKTGQQHDGDRVPGQPFGQALGSIVVIDLPHNQRVVDGDLLIRECHIGLWSSCLTVLKGETNQKPVESLVAAVESIHRVMALKPLDPERNHLHASFFKHAGPIEKSGETRGRARGCVKGGLKCAPLFPVQAEAPPIRKSLLGVGKGAREHKIAHRSALR